PDDANDGDSFHVKYKNRHYIFRLYYVDAPETDDSFPERVKEQAEYWGISEGETMRLGNKAAKFTRKWLTEGPFTVYSTLQDARGRSDKKRYYAIVQRGENDLAQALMEQGLARIYGYRPDMPDGTKSTIIYWRLKSAEKNAKANKLGGWADDLERVEPETRTRRFPRPATLEPGTPAPAPAGPPEIEEQTVTLTRAVSVFSLKNPGVRVGVLQPGANVKVLEAVPPDMVRIRFMVEDGKAYEAQCRRADLGL
ncbi:MAG: thermonuclease family protein, partial [Kiritimatiellae bacterium]|nr:thermonuclease family protein [Kiritimatiellia bacterium]